MKNKEKRRGGLSAAAPLRGMRKHEQVQTGEQKQDKCEERQKADPDGLLLLQQSDDIDDDRRVKAIDSQR
jgi:hypothetical protein